MSWAYYEPALNPAKQNRCVVCGCPKANGTPFVENQMDLFCELWHARTIRKILRLKAERRANQ